VRRSPPSDEPWGYECFSSGPARSCSVLFANMGIRLSKRLDSECPHTRLSPPVSAVSQELPFARLLPDSVPSFLVSTVSATKREFFLHPSNSGSEPPLVIFVPRPFYVYAHVVLCPLFTGRPIFPFRCTFVRWSIRFCVDSVTPHPSGRHCPWGLACILSPTVRFCRTHTSPPTIIPLQCRIDVCDFTRSPASTFAVWSRWCYRVCIRSFDIGESGIPQRSRNFLSFVSLCELFSPAPSTVYCTLPSSPNAPGYPLTTSFSAERFVFLLSLACGIFSDRICSFDPLLPEA